MSDTIEIVCPMLENRDEDRFKLLVKSLDRFIKEKNYKLHLINQSGKSPVRSKRIISYKESDIDPVFYKLIPELTNHYGWWKQQLLKLMSYRICSSECILFVDCDCFLTKSLEKKNLYKNKKLRINLRPECSFNNWYNGSRRILKVPNFPIPTQKIDVIPIVLSGKILQSLEKYLRFAYSDSFIEVLLSNTNKGNYLPKSLSKLFDQGDSSSTWTETTLYHIFAEQTGMISEYHTIDYSYECYGNCVWDENQIESWKPKLSFKRGHKFYFTVVQSSIVSKKADWVKQQIKEYLYD